METAPNPMQEDRARLRRLVNGLCHTPESAVSECARIYRGTPEGWRLHLNYCLKQGYLVVGRKGWLAEGSKPWPKPVKIAVLDPVEDWDEFDFQD